MFIIIIFLLFHSEGAAFILLRVSYVWYPMIGTFILIIVGTLVSLLTGRQDPDQLDPKLCYNFLRRWIGNKRITNKVGNYCIWSVLLACHLWTVLYNLGGASNGWWGENQHRFWTLIKLYFIWFMLFHNTIIYTLILVTRCRKFDQFWNNK